MSLNFWKNAVTILSVYQISHAWKLRAYHGSAANYLAFSYENASQICLSGYFNETWDTYGYAHGYRNSLEADGAKNFINTLCAQGNWNVLGTDWSSEANSPLIGFDYVLFAKKVATELALALGSMLCFKPEKSTLTGISLGAQITGQAGREYAKNTGFLIREIIGCDPASPGYQSPQFFDGIDKDCASFVQIIHTDCLKYGIRDSRGDVDYFPNYDVYLKDHHQPGCPPNSPAPFYTLTTNDTCSHRQSLLHLTDSIKYPGELLATKYDTVEDWVAAKGAANEVTCMGYLADKEKSGNYYLTTNLGSPYGKGLPGLVPATTQ